MIDEINLKKAIKKNINICIPSVLSLVIYVTLVEFYLDNLGTQYNLPEYLDYFFLGTAGLILYFIRLKKRQILIGREIKGKYIFGLIPNPVKPSPENNKKFSKEETFIQRLQLAHIVAYVLSEGIAIIGLVTFILRRDKIEFYVLVGVAFVMMLIHWPKFSDWQQRLQEFITET